MFVATQKIQSFRGIGSVWRHPSNRFAIKGPTERGQLLFGARYGLTDFSTLLMQNYVYVNHVTVVCSERV